MQAICRRPRFENIVTKPETQKSTMPTGRFPKLHRAVHLATLWHAGQDRKYSLVPYIVHPLRVMSIVRSVSDDEAMLCAAVLHDVVEDTLATEHDVRREFGDEVADLVMWLTDVSVPEDGNRAARKDIDLQHTANASPDAQTIKLADLIDNTTSITGADPHFAVVYMAEKERLLEVLDKGHPELQARAQVLLREFQENKLQEAPRNG